jgi:hypothetical protein
MSGIAYRNLVSLSAMIFTLCTLFFVAVPVHAQFGSMESAFSLGVSPSFPKPHTAVTIRLQDYSINAVGAAVFWFVDGVEQTAAKNERSLTIEAGAVGTEQTVQAILRQANGEVSTSVVIRPTVVDLVLESETYVPSFYKGRALPNRNGTVRAIALVHDGETHTANTYAYRWTLGEDVLFAGPVLGKQSVSFDMPLFNKNLSVEVFDASGKSVGRSAMILDAVEPELHFYEWSPLKGLYQRELSDPFVLIGEETVVYGEPYFVTRSPEGEMASFAWRVNGAPVTPNTLLPQALTIQKALGTVGDTTLRVITNGRVPAVLEKGFTVVN